MDYVSTQRWQPATCRALRRSPRPTDCSRPLTPAKLSLPSNLTVPKWVEHIKLYCRDCLNWTQYLISLYMSTARHRPFRERATTQGPLPFSSIRYQGPFLGWWSSEQEVVLHCAFCSGVLRVEWRVLNTSAPTAVSSATDWPAHCHLVIWAILVTLVLPWMSLLRILCLRETTSIALAIAHWATLNLRTRPTVKLHRLRTTYKTVQSQAPYLETLGEFILPIWSSCFVCLYCCNDDNG